MPQATTAPITVPERLTQLYEPILPELSEVEAVLRKEASSRFPEVDPLLRHSFRLGGKRLRPALLLLSARAAGGQIAREHILLAAVVEMIHTATLVHDDVLDEAAVRRHLDTVNARWNNQSSVLLGDFLFSHAFYLASTVGSTFACQSIGRSTNIVCEGELRQVANRGNLLLSEDDYLSIIEAKTAELCACCCRLGAHYAETGSEAAQRLENYGRYVGIAFQIADDLLDLVGEEDAAGKSLGTDLAQQKMTLPLIRLASQIDSNERRRLFHLLSGPAAERRGELQAWLAGSDALGYARQQAQLYAHRAVAELRGLPVSHEREVLERLGRFVVERRQ
jgi:octaprenyl-diphosphate synthase